MRLLLQAQLKGKLTRNEEDLEDLLTSNVFGSLDYANDINSLQMTLCLAVDDNHLNWFRDLSISGAKYEFWQPLNNKGCRPCEPDVLIHVKDRTTQEYLILVESKYFSGISSQVDENLPEPAHQLAKEWDNLIRETDKTGAIPVLLFVTSDFGFPSFEVAEAKREFSKKRNNVDQPRILWISWRLIQKIIGQSNSRIVSDAAAILRKLNLILFTGISVVNYSISTWAFEASDSFDWNPRSQKLSSWRFDNQKFFTWSLSRTISAWRYKR